MLAELTKTMDKTEAKESYLRTEKKAVEDAKAEMCIRDRLGNTCELTIGFHKIQ